MVLLTELIVLSCVFVLPVVNQSASAIPKTWRKANDVISAGDAPQMEDKVRKG